MSIDFAEQPIESQRTFLDEHGAAGPNVADQLCSIRRRLTWLTAAIFLVAVALLLFVAGVLASEIDYHYGEYKLIAGTATGGVVMGFLFGWLARRSC